MLSTFVRRSSAVRSVPAVFGRHQRQPQVLLSRTFPLIPPSQYDMPWPKKLSLRHVLRVYWETIPLFCCIVFSGFLVVVFSAWSVLHKVDVVYKGHKNENISRTMDLRNPTIHQLLMVNSNSKTYEPWPEMQDVLDKMQEAERKAALETCNKPK
ncbi:uncharacterized protein LOC128683542 [Plodia interpunctella]|uniref:uncharacterized protein LOC128683542 n=1 Tax=Plodia interpunctella TaxID=58824 RepID=UPI002368AAC0|nr:uncharacterized protein LOC128683542 [Plodia interpunctella]